MTPAASSRAQSVYSVASLAGAPLPSIVPRRFTDDPHLVLLNGSESPVAERYRRLRVSLDRGTPESPLPVQMSVITSAIPGEGKTTTAMNLALAYAEDREVRTLLVGADLRRPSVSEYITPAPTLGLSEVLAGEVPLDDALLGMSNSRLRVLPAGTPKATPCELLQTGHLETLTAELRRRFDRIVVDTPPTVPFTDAAALASHADGALLVVRAGTTTAALIRRAMESLFGANLLGVVLNEIEFTPVDRYYYGYDEYEPGRYPAARTTAQQA